MNRNIIKKAVRNKLFDEGTIDGYTVAAVDGTNLFNDKQPYCDDCILKRSKGNEYYSHSIAAMSLIGETTSLVLRF